MIDRAPLRAVYRRTRAAMLAAMPETLRTELQQTLRARILPAVTRAPIVGQYAAVRGEIDPGVFAAAAWPRVSPTTGLLTFHLCGPDQLRPGFGGILEPPPGAPTTDPDLLLVPLVACDPYGTRLGQGGGHYDRTLAALRARKAVRAVGLAWECQVADALPRAPWDQPLDAIATPHRWIIPPG